MEKTRHAMHACGYHIVLRASFDRDIFTEDPQVSLDIVETICSLDLEGVTVELAKVLGHAVYLNVRISPDTGVKTFIDRAKRKTVAMLKAKHEMFNTRVSSIWSREHYVWTEGTVDIDEVFSYATAVKGGK